MKEIEIKKVKAFYGNPIMVASYDDNGEMVMEENKRGIRDVSGKLIEEPMAKEAGIKDLIELLIRSFPKDRMTIDNIHAAIKIRDRMRVAEDKIIFEDNEYDWIIKNLKNNEIGVKIFGLDLPNVLEAMGSNL